MVGKRTGLRFAMAMLAAALFGGPALAAAPEPESSGLQLAAWVVQTTDMPAAQVAIAGSQNVYSVEPLGPPAATGEVIARVRTEAVDANWSAAHNFQSWEAHALFDCAGKRVRIIRSASYPERNLKGSAKVDDLGGGWFAPQPAEPAAVLLAAACDRDFAWPLRAATAQPPAATPGTAPLVKTTVDTPAAAPASEDAATPTRRSPSRPAVSPRRTEVAAAVVAPPAIGPPSGSTYEPAASLQKANFVTATRAPVVAEASLPAPRGRLAMLTTAPNSAVAAVRRWAGTGEGFVTRRASSVRRWLAWREPSRTAVRQAAL